MGRSSRVFLGPMCSPTLLECLPLPTTPLPACPAQRGQVPWISAKPTLSMGPLLMPFPCYHLAKPETNSSKPASSRKASQSTTPALESCCLQGQTCQTLGALWDQMPERWYRQTQDLSGGTLCSIEGVVHKWPLFDDQAKSNSCVGRTWG